jgi:hypothetical protein
VKAFQDFEGGPCVDHRLSNALTDALEKCNVCEIIKKVCAPALVLLMC